MKYTINNIYVYMRISHNCYDKYIEYTKKREFCRKGGMGIDGEEFAHWNNIKMYEYAVQTIIFSALSIEAFINDFSLFYLGKDNFEMLDKLDVKSKILVSIKMVTGKDFPKNKVVYERITKLISLRNKLVHAKSLDYASEAAKVLYEIDKKELDNAISIYDLLIDEIDSIDKDLNIKEYYINNTEIRDWYYLNS